MEKVSCQLSTPTKMHKCKIGELVLLPAQNGEMGVLSNHAPMIVALKEGKIKIFDTSNLMETITINGGVAYIKAEGIEILCNSFAINS